MNKKLGNQKLFVNSKYFHELKKLSMNSKNVHENIKKKKRKIKIKNIKDKENTKQKKEKWWKNKPEWPTQTKDVCEGGGEAET